MAGPSLATKPLISWEELLLGGDDDDDDDDDEEEQEEDFFSGALAGSRAGRGDRAAARPEEAEDPDRGLECHGQQAIKSSQEEDFFSGSLAGRHAGQDDRAAARPGEAKDPDRGLECRPQQEEDFFSGAPAGMHAGGGDDRAATRPEEAKKPDRELECHAHEEEDFFSMALAGSHARRDDRAAARPEEVKSDGALECRTQQEEDFFSGALACSRAARGNRADARPEEAEPDNRELECHTQQARSLQRQIIVEDLLHSHLAEGPLGPDVQGLSEGEQCPSGDGRECDEADLFVEPLHLSIMVTTKDKADWTPSTPSSERRADFGLAASRSLVPALDLRLDDVDLSADKEKAADVGSGESEAVPAKGAGEKLQASFEEKQEDGLDTSEAPSTAASGPFTPTPPRDGPEDAAANQKCPKLSEQQEAALAILRKKQAARFASRGQLVHADGPQPWRNFIAASSSQSTSAAAGSKSSQESKDAAHGAEQAMGPANVEELPLEGAPRILPGADGSLDSDSLARPQQAEEDLPLGAQQKAGGEAADPCPEKPGLGRRTSERLVTPAEDPKQEEASFEMGDQSQRKLDVEAERLNQQDQTQEKADVEAEDPNQGMTDAQAEEGGIRPPSSDALELQQLHGAAQPCGDTDLAGSEVPREAEEEACRHLHPTHPQADGGDEEVDLTEEDSSMCVPFVQHVVARAIEQPFSPWNTVGTNCFSAAASSPRQSQLLPEAVQVMQSEGGLDTHAQDGNPSIVADIEAHDLVTTETSETTGEERIPLEAPATSADGTPPLCQSLPSAPEVDSGGDFTRPGEERVEPRCLEEVLLASSHGAPFAARAESSAGAGAGRGPEAGVAAGHVEDTAEQPSGLNSCPEHGDMTDCHAAVVSAAHGLVALRAHARREQERLAAVRLQAAWRGRLARGQRVPARSSAGVSTPRPPKSGGHRSTPRPPPKPEMAAPKPEMAAPKPEMAAPTPEMAAPKPEMTAKIPAPPRHRATVAFDPDAQSRAQERVRSARHAGRQGKQHHHHHAQIPTGSAGAPLPASRAARRHNIVDLLDMAEVRNKDPPAETDSIDSPPKLPLVTPGRSSSTPPAPRQQVVCATAPTLTPRIDASRGSMRRICANERRHGGACPKGSAGVAFAARSPHVEATWDFVSPRRKWG